METRLKEFRQRKGLTGEQFARIIGIDPATLSNIENPNSKRNSPVTNKIINAIYEKFGVRYEELFPYEPKKYAPFTYKNAELEKAIESVTAFDKQYEALVNALPYLSEPVKLFKYTVDAVGDFNKKITITILGQDGSEKSRLINNLCGKTLLPESWDNPIVCPIHVLSGPSPKPNFRYYIFKNKIPHEKDTEAEKNIDEAKKDIKKTIEDLTTDQVSASEYVDRTFEIGFGNIVNDIENFNVEKISDKEYFDRFIESYGGVDVFSTFALESGSRCNGMAYTAVVFDDAEILTYADIIEIPTFKAEQTESTNVTYYDKSLINESICIYCSMDFDFLNTYDFVQLDATGVTDCPPVHLLLYVSGYDPHDDYAKSLDEQIRTNSIFNSEKWCNNVSIAYSLDINEKLKHALDKCVGFVQKNNEIHRGLCKEIIKYMNKIAILDTELTMPSGADLLRNGPRRILTYQKTLETRKRFTEELNRIFNDVNKRQDEKLSEFKKATQDIIQKSAISLNSIHYDFFLQHIKSAQIEELYNFIIENYSRYKVSLTPQKYRDGVNKSDEESYKRIFNNIKRYYKYNNDFDNLDLLIRNLDNIISKMKETGEIVDPKKESKLEAEGNEIEKKIQLEISKDSVLKSIYDYFEDHLKSLNGSVANIGPLIDAIVIIAQGYKAEMETISQWKKMPTPLEDLATLMYAPMIIVIR